MSSSNRELDALVRRLGPPIHRRCLKLLGRSEEASDASQEVFLRVYRNPRADFTRYDKVLVEPVTAWGSAQTEVDMDRLQVLIDYLDASIRHSLAQDYALVERSGPGVMRLRVAITEAEGSNVPLDVVSNVLPQPRRP